MSEAYMYGLRGPWPQPSPILPFGFAPAVVHIPWEEQLDFAIHVMGRLHFTSNFFQPVARLYALFNPGLESIDDAEFARLLGRTAFSKFLNATFDPPDRVAFAPWLADRAETSGFVKADFSAMAYMKPMPGTYTAATVTLFESVDGGYVARAIAVDGLVLTPADGPAWDLAKYFVMQGVTTHMVLGGHACLHFPMDTINAITKSTVPALHPLLKLLAPHFRFSLALDDGVLHHPRTLLNNSPSEVFTPFTSTGYDLLEPVYMGIPGNSSYPGYKFVPRVPVIHSPYGNFLSAYYALVYAFVEEVVARIVPGDPVVATWANHIHGWLPGFPDGTAIFEDDLLTATLAFIICDVSVMHAADHFDFASQPLTRTPLRLRVPPPTSRDMAPFDRAALVTREDMFRYKMAHEMFFKPNNVTLLQDVDYAFAERDLIQANQRFRRDLRRVDEDMPGHRYVPLSQIAASVQY